MILEWIMLVYAISLVIAILIYEVKKRGKKQ